MNAKSRMFWNVRAMPPAAMELVFIPEIVRPSKTMRPVLGA